MHNYYPIKQQLYISCNNYVNQRISAAQHAINEARSSAAEDTKSSAGDKYETGREMMQQETNRHTAQLHEAQKLKHALSQIRLSEQAASVIVPGSLVLTSNGNFYLSISAGSFLINGVNYFAISPASPIGMQLKGLQVNDSFMLNQKSYKITGIG